MWTWLECVDFEENANRWYAIGVQLDLFGQLVVARYWGSRRTRAQRLQAEPFDDAGAARIAADRLIREKVGRGYRVVDGYVPESLSLDEFGALARKGAEDADLVSAIVSSFIAR